MGKVINFVLFQVCWIACVWGAAVGAWWLGVVAVTIFASLELARSPARGRELLLIAVLAVIGFTIDTGYVVSGLLEYASPVPSAAVAPAWIVALWVSFGLTLNRSLAWLAGRHWLSAICGLVGGPLAYWIAIDTWGAGVFLAPRWQALMVIGVAWALATPLLVDLARRIAPPRPLPAPQVA